MIGYCVSWNWRCLTDTDSVHYTTARRQDTPTMYVGTLVLWRWFLFFFYTYWIRTLHKPWACLISIFIFIFYLFIDFLIFFFGPFFFFFFFFNPPISWISFPFTLPLFDLFYYFNNILFSPACGPIRAHLTILILITPYRHQIIIIIVIMMMTSCTLYLLSL